MNFLSPPHIEGSKAHSFTGTSVSGKEVSDCDSITFETDHR